jgi:uncharacterized membrane protein
MQAQALVPAILPVHILAGMLALLFGYAALYAAKGATFHRRSGMLFVGAMAAMALSGALMEALKVSRVSVNVIAGLLTFYFVATGLLTIRRRPEEFPWINRAATLVGFTVSVLAFNAGFGLLSSGRPETAPCFIFGVVGMLAAIGDVRMIRAGGIEGPLRIKRHLWRMCFAMWVAAASFFWGPPNRVPEVIRIPALQAFAVLVPIFAMLYWLWRLRARKALPGQTPRAFSKLRLRANDHAPDGASQRA